MSGLKSLSLSATPGLSDMSVITATVWITIGITFYGGDFVGSNLACNGHTYSPDSGEWAAVPIEWVLSGQVACGDILYAEMPNGTTWEGPILDTGCHLHYPVWDTGLPFGVDFPIYVRHANALDGKLVPTGTGAIAIYKREQSGWWNPPPGAMTAWATRWCNGPLTIRRTSGGRMRVK